MTNAVRVARPWLTPAMLAMIATAALAACDGDRSVEDYLARARGLQAAGKSAASVAELKGALGKYPDSTDARALLGAVYLDAGKGADAAKELQRARRLGAADEAVRSPLIRAWLLQQDYDRVLLELPAGINLTGELLVLRGQALAATGRVDAAREDFRTAVAIDSGEAAYVGLTLLALARGDRDAADHYLAEGLAENPDDVGLLVLEGERLLRARRYGAAEAPLRRATQAEPGHFGARINLAIAWLGQLRAVNAGSALDTLQSEAPGHGMATLLRASASFIAADYGAALRGANTLTSRGSANPLALLVAGAAHLALGNDETANRLILRYFEVTRDASAQPQSTGIEVVVDSKSRAYETRRNRVSVALAGPPLLQLLGAGAIANGDTEIGLSLVERVPPGPDAAPSPAAELIPAIHLIATQIQDGALTAAIAGAERLQAQSQRARLFSRGSGERRRRQRPGRPGALSKGLGSEAGTHWRRARLGRGRQALERHGQRGIVAQGHCRGLPRQHSHAHRTGQPGA